MGDKTGFVCSNCNRSYHNKSNLNRHMVQAHSIGRPYARRNMNKYKCPLCGMINFLNYEEFKGHLLQTHDITLDLHYFKFQSQSRFLAWKKKAEEQTKSYYSKDQKIFGRKVILIAGETNPCVTKKAGIIHYRCHRSGYFKLKDETERKRRCRTQGSIRINAYCPAKISARFKSNGSVKVVYCSTHVGHKCEVSTLRLTEEEKREIAAKIAANIPYDVILDEVRNTAGSSISRKHILRKKDLITFAKSTYFKKFCQSESNITSQNHQSSVDLILKDESLNLDANPRIDGEMDFDDTEIQTFDPNEFFDSDLDILSEDEEEENDKSQYKHVGKNSHSVFKQQLTNNKPTSKSPTQGKPTTAAISLDQSTVSQKQAELIKKFSTKVKSLESLKDIVWVENHLNRMFIVMKSMKERPEVGKKNFKCRNRSEGSTSQITDPVFAQNLKRSASKIHSIPKKIRSQLVPHMSSPSRSKSQGGLKVGSIKSLTLKTGQFKNTSSNNSPGIRKIHLKPICKSKTDTQKISGSKKVLLAPPISILKTQKQSHLETANNLKSILRNSNIKSNHEDRNTPLKPVSGSKIQEARNEGNGHVSPRPVSDSESSKPTLIKEGNEQIICMAVDDVNIQTEKRKDDEQVNVIAESDSYSSADIGKDNEQIISLQDNDLNIQSEENEVEEEVHSSGSTLLEQSECGEPVVSKSISDITSQQKTNEGDEEVNLKPVSKTKVEESPILTTVKIKQYLVPIAGKPDKFLIVQTNGPPPVGPLTPVTPKQKQSHNKNQVFVDHNYSSL